MGKYLIPNSNKKYTYIFMNAYMYNHFLLVLQNANAYLTLIMQIQILLRKMMQKYKCKYSEK